MCVKERETKQCPCIAIHVCYLINSSRYEFMIVVSFVRTCIKYVSRYSTLSHADSCQNKVSINGPMCRNNYKGYMITTISIDWAS